MNALFNVVSAELMKVFSKRRTYVLAGLYWVLMPIVLLLVGRVVLSSLGGSFLESEGLPVDILVHSIASPFGMSRLAVVGPAYMNPSFYMMIIALFAALLIGEERSHNMWKTTLVAQPSRAAVYWGKFLVAWIAFAVLLVGSILCNFLFGAVGTTFLGTGFSGEWGAMLQAALVQILFAPAAIAFAFLLVFLLRNVALGLVSIFFLPALLEGLYTLYAGLVGFQPLTRFNMVFQALNLQRALEDLPRFFFTSNFYAPSRGLAVSLLELLGAGPVELQGPMAGLVGGSMTLQHSALVMAGYFVLFGGLGWWLFNRRDVA